MYIAFSSVGETEPFSIAPSLSSASLPSSAYYARLSHNGPERNLKPAAKSNRKLIKNALCHVCLAGEVNLATKHNALSVC